LDAFVYRIFSWGLCVWLTDWKWKDPSPNDDVRVEWETGLHAYLLADL